MVQLHFDDDSIRVLMSTSRDLLRDPWFRALEVFYEELEADPSISSVATKRNYLVKIRQFLLWLQQHEIAPLDIDRDILRKFLLYLKLEKRLKPSALQVYIRALKRFLKTIGKPELAEELRYPREKQIAYQLPDPETVERIIEELKDLRYKTILALLYETGARISEILNLRREDVEEAPEGFYRLKIVDTKNNEFRYVYVIKYANLLRTYLQSFNPQTWLFPSPSKKNRPLNPRNVEKLLRRLSEQYGVKLYPHLLRHLRATLLVKEGLQERVVMKLLGHRSEKMMRIYVNLAAKDVEEALLSKLGIKTDSETQEVVDCPRCGAKNLKDANYCWRCGTPLKTLAALELEEKKRRLEELLARLERLLEEHPELYAKLFK